MKTRQVTVWSDRFEVFLEHEAIVAGSGVDFVTHVTNLQTLEPRREGPAELLLVSGTQKKVVEAAAPDRPGIYVPEIEFPSPGRWEVSLRIPEADGAHEVDLGAFEAHATRQEALESTMPEAPEGISFLKEQQWKVLVETAPVVRAPVVERMALPGVVRARPGGRAFVSPPLAGTLLPPEGRPFPAPGDTVEAGQVLGLVQPPALDLLAKIAEAERIPQVDLDLLYRRLEHSEENAFDVGISVPIPIFNRNQGRLAEARAETAVAEARARSIRNDMAERLMEAHQVLARAVHSTRLLREEVIPRAETVLRAAEARYGAGDIRLLEAIAARREYLELRLSYLEALRDMLEAWSMFTPFLEEAPRED